MVALLLTLAAACSAEQRDPVGLDDPPDNPGTGGGGGGGGAADEAFVGEWENVVIIQAGGDLQTTTTRWRFEADADCLQTYVLESALDGVLDLRVEPCTWDNDGLLLELAEDRTGPRREFVPLTHPLTHEQMAQAVGASRPHVSSVLRDLEEAGAVRRGRGRDLRVAPARLAELLGTEPLVAAA